MLYFESPCWSRITIVSAILCFQRKHRPWNHADVYFQVTARLQKDVIDKKDTKFGVVTVYFGYGIRYFICILQAGVYVRFFILFAHNFVLRSTWRLKFLGHIFSRTLLPLIPSKLTNFYYYYVTKLTIQKNISVQKSGAIGESATTHGRQVQRTFFSIFKFIMIKSPYVGNRK